MENVSFIVEASNSKENKYVVSVALSKENKNLGKKILAYFLDQELAENYRDYLQQNIKLSVITNQEVNKLKIQIEEETPIVDDHYPEDWRESMMDFFAPAMEAYGDNEDAFWDSYNDD